MTGPRKVVVGLDPDKAARDDLSHMVVVAPESTERQRDILAAAQVHAQLARVALLAELAIDPRTGNALARPAESGRERSTGTPWGQAIYGTPG